MTSARRGRGDGLRRMRQPPRADGPAHHEEKQDRAQEQLLLPGQVEHRDKVIHRSQGGNVCQAASRDNEIFGLGAALGRIVAPPRGALNSDSARSARTLELDEQKGTKTTKA